MRRAGNRFRGFTLMEMLIAPTISLILLSGAIMAGVRLQRATAMQRQTAELQTAGRAVKELIAASVASAGSGLGSAAITVGTTATASVINGSNALHYAVDAQTGAVFSSDATFGLPTGQYAGLTSDALEVWKGDTDGMVAAGFCSGGSTFRTNTTICTATSAAALAGQNVLVVNPTLRSACVYKVSNPQLVSGVYQIRIAAATGRQAPPGGEPCDLLSDTDAFWKTTGAYLIPVMSVAYRVNWAGGAPVLETDSDGSVGAAAWQAAATGVERLQVRQGAISFTAPANAPAFFPSADGAHMGIDQCTDAACAALVPGGMDGNDSSAVAALERRVRVIEFDITMRSKRSNPDAVLLKSNGNFDVDSEGHLTDGYVRRQFVFRVAPRNFRIAGLVQN